MINKTNNCYLHLVVDEGSSHMVVLHSALRKLFLAGLVNPNIDVNRRHDLSRLAL